MLIRYISIKKLSKVLDDFNNEKRRKRRRVEALDNIAASIGVGLEPNMAGTEIIYELILQGMLELDDMEREIVYLRYGLKMDELRIGNTLGMTCEEIQQQSLSAKQKLEKVLKGTL